MRLLCLLVVSVLGFSCGSPQPSSTDSGVEPIKGCSGSPFGTYRLKGVIDCPASFPHGVVSNRVEITFTRSEDGGTVASIGGSYPQGGGHRVVQNDCTILVEEQHRAEATEMIFHADNTLEIVGVDVCKLAVCVKDEKGDPFMTYADGGELEMRAPLSCNLRLRK